MEASRCSLSSSVIPRLCAQCSACQVAGWDITNKLKGMMGAHIGQEFASNSRVMQSLKEKVCSIAGDAGAVTQAHDDVDEESKSFELPDGKIIQARLGTIIPPEYIAGSAH
eukprot:1523456-Amphidinium_carterae.1